MIIQVLVSTMNQTNIKKLIKSMKLNKYVIINQVTNDIDLPSNVTERSVQVHSFKGKGLSRSRNKAILNSYGDICVIADDDMYYVDGYEQIIENAYKKYPNADIITFFVDNEDQSKTIKKLKEGRLSLLNTMKIASWQITFRRESILESKILMDESFGTGTNKFMGEENIFLFDCHKKGLCIYYVPNKIATMEKDSVSTWFRGFNEEYFRVKGMVFYRMSKLFAALLVLQFAVRKKSLYKSKMSTVLAIRYMLAGLIQQAKNEK